MLQNYFRFYLQKAKDSVPDKVIISLFLIAGGVSRKPTFSIYFSFMKNECCHNDVDKG